VFKSRSTHMQPLRYYVYISDTKLDMLFEQIEKGMLKRISAEIRVDLKLASVTLREAETAGPSRIAKLRVVERYIDAHHHVGTVQKPGMEYFRGQMDMQWGQIPNLDASSRLSTWLQGFVWFQGSASGGSQRLGLGGSWHNVLGQERNALERKEFNTSSSILYAIMEALRQGSSSVLDHELRHGVTEKGLKRFAAAEWDQDIAANPTQRLDFLAVPLLERQIKTKDHEVHLLLGSPLYVAMARQPGKDDISLGVDSHSPGRSPPRLAAVTEPPGRQHRQRDKRRTL
jgi:hypothetical protein